MALAGEKGSPIWKAYGASRQGFLAAMTDKAVGRSSNHNVSN